MSAPKRLDIQGLRAVAVAMVIAFHAGLPVPGGSAGVDVFFAISGFVITGLLVRELEVEGRISLSRFYARRARRLLPALAVMLLVVAALGNLLAPAGAVRISGFTGVFAALFSANGYLYTLPSDYYSVSDQLNPLLHTWTLAVEEQFYVVFPVLLFVGWRIGIRRGRRAGRIVEVVAIGGLTLGSFVFANSWSQNAGLGLLRSPSSFAFYASPARAWEFGLGALVALSLPLLRRLPVLVLSALAAIGFSATAAACLTAQDVGTGLSSLAIPVFGACCLLVAGTRPNLISNLLSVAPLVAVGDVSYSLYLWHWPFIVFARGLAPTTGWVAPAAAALSIAPAWASYRWIENPIRRSKRVHGKRALALASACTAIPVAASFGLILAAPAGGASGFAPHLDEVSRCDKPAPFGDPSRAACTWRVPHSHGTVVLIGDSNAGQFSEPVVDAARRAGYSASIATMGGCPFNQHATEPPAKPSCQRFQQMSLSALISARPNLVIIGARTDKYLARDILYVDQRAPTVAFPSSRLRLWTDSLHGELVALNSAGIPVVVVDSIPELSFPDTRSCSKLLLRLGGCQATVDRRIADAALRPLIAADAAAVRHLSAASTLNVEDEICGRERCVAVRGDGERVYKDEDHITVAAARRLSPIFYQAIVAHAR
ncbi:MAG TPA: acyltransferase family protein [Gaiellaceae bacterium]|nr:acyltransferase family protein [Gaiellaceae bacterium]